MSETKPDCKCVVENLYDPQILPEGWVMLRREPDTDPADGFLGIKMLGVDADPLAENTALKRENEEVWDWIAEFCELAGVKDVFALRSLLTQANARLIAAAPEQNTALIDLVALVKRIIPDARSLHEIQNADDAIRKASR